MKIGKSMRRIRKEQKMTLASLAQKSGVALATLSRMENNKMTGTLKSHVRICDALGISLPELYKDLSSSARTVDAHSAKAPETGVFVHDRKSSMEMLASKSLNKKMMPTLITLGPDGNTATEETKRGVEKFIYVLDGKVEARIGDQAYVLGRGDTLYFESSIAHQFKNLASDQSRMVCVTCPPSF